MNSIAVASTDSPVLLAGVMHEDFFARGISLREHESIHGTVLRAGRRSGRHLDDALATLNRDDVRGRGGANFPFAIKLEAAAKQRRKPVVVVNAAEGEPASAKDLVLLSRNPHLVLDGAIASARLLGTGEVVIWLHHNSPALAGLRSAIDQRAGSCPDISFTIAQAPDRFVSGQVTSVVQGLSGGPALPYTLREQPTSRGINSRPTLVSNAETYAHVAIALQHPHEFSGRLLTTVMTSDGGRTVVETLRGTSVRQVLNTAGLIDPQVPVLAGGYAGSWIAPSRLSQAVVDSLVLTNPDVRLGVALFALPDPQWCPVQLTAALVSWLAGQSAGQCGPCTFGLPDMAGALRRIAHGSSLPSDRDNLVRWLPLLAGRGACAHPDGVVALVRSTGEVFAQHLWDHVNGVPCEFGSANYPWPSIRTASVVGS